MTTARHATPDPDDAPAAQLPTTRPEYDATHLLKTAVVPNRWMVAVTGLLVLVVLAIGYVANDPGSSSSTSTTTTASAPTITPLGCPVHVVDQYGDTGTDDPYCTQGALASRLCDLTLIAPPVESGHVLFWSAGSGGQVEHVASNTGQSFMCDNYSEGRARTRTFTDAQWRSLIAPGADTPAIDALIGS